MIVPLELTGLTKVFDTESGPFVAVKDVNARVKANQRLTKIQGELWRAIKGVTIDAGLAWPTELSTLLYAFRDAAIAKGRESERWSWETGRRRVAGDVKGSHHDMADHAEHVALCEHQDCKAEVAARRADPGSGQP